MLFSKRAVPFDTLLLGEILLGALLFLPARPVRAGGDGEGPDERWRQGGIAARDVVEPYLEDSRDRSRFFYGDDRGPDPVLLRGGRVGDRYGNLDDPEQARRRVAEEMLDRLEQRLNRPDWIPFRDRGRDREEDGDREREDARGRDRKHPVPDILFGLEDPMPAPPVTDDSWMSHFRLSLSRGLEYRQEWETGPNRKLQMRLYGPVVPGGPGLGLQLRGHVLDRRFRLNAYGGASEAGLAVDVEF
jgi:hypothetical protein